MLKKKKPVKMKCITFLLVFIAPVFTSGQMKLEDLKIDTTITGFRFSADWSGTTVYTKNGSSDLKAVNPSAFSFSLFANTAFQAAVEQLYALTMMSEESGYIISNFTTKDTLLNGYKTFLISYIETEKGTQYKNVVFNAVVMKENTAIVFVSGDLDNGIYTDKFRNTFFSIKL